jgi:4'-phosphopantetheinyl transferase
MDARQDRRPVRLDPGACHVWWARTAAARPALAALLDRDERGRLASLHRRADRDRFLVAAALLRLALARYLGRPPAAVPLSRTCPRCGAPHGKPSLADGALIEVSVSHAGERVAVAVAGAPVGVDLEPVAPGLEVDALAELSLAPAEASALRGLEGGERARAFLVYWTRKEAALKAAGAGLAVPLPSVRVSAPGQAPELLSWPPELPDRATLTLRDLPLDRRYVASLAVLGRCERVTVLDGSALVGRWPPSPRQR